MGTRWLRQLQEGTPVSAGVLPAHGLAVRCWERAASHHWQHWALLHSKLPGPGEPSMCWQGSRSELVGRQAALLGQAVLCISSVLCCLCRTGGGLLTAGLEP